MRALQSRIFGSIKMNQARNYATIINNGGNTSNVFPTKIPEQLNRESSAYFKESFLHDPTFTIMPTKMHIENFGNFFGHTLEKLNNDGCKYSANILRAADWFREGKTKAILTSNLPAAIDWSQYAPELRFSSNLSNLESRKALALSENILPAMMLWGFAITQLDLDFYCYSAEFKDLAAISVVNQTEPDKPDYFNTEGPHTDALQTCGKPKNAEPYATSIHVVESIGKPAVIYSIDMDRLLRSKFSSQELEILKQPIFHLCRNESHVMWGAHYVQSHPFAIAFEENGKLKVRNFHSDLIDLDNQTYFIDDIVETKLSSEAMAVLKKLSSEVRAAIRTQYSMQVAIPKQEAVLFRHDVHSKYDPPNIRQIIVTGFEDPTSPSSKIDIKSQKPMQVAPKNSLIK